MILFLGPTLCGLPMWITNNSFPQKLKEKYKSPLRCVVPSLERSRDTWTITWDGPDLVMTITLL